MSSILDADVLQQVIPMQQQILQLMNLQKPHMFVIYFERETK